MWLDLGDDVGSIVDRAMLERRAVLPRVWIFFCSSSGEVMKIIAPGRCLGWFRASPA